MVISPVCLYGHQPSLGRPCLGLHHSRRVTCACSEKDSDDDDDVLHPTGSVSHAAKGGVFVNVSAIFSTEGVDQAVNSQQVFSSRFAADISPRKE